MIKKLILAGVVVLMAISLKPTATTASDLQRLTVQLNWVSNVQFAGILVAKSKGWYRQNGIDIKIKERQPGAISTDEVINGRAQIGVVEGGELIKSIANGAKLKAIGAIFQRSPFCLLSKQSSGIKSVMDLNGKRIGVNSQESIFMIKIMLGSQGLSLDDVQIIPAGGSVNHLRENLVDGITGFMNNENIIMRDLGYTIDYIPAFKHGYDFYSSVYFTSDKLIRKNPQLIQTFLSVTMKGWKYSFSDTDSTAALIIEEFYEKGTLEHQTRSLEAFRYLAMLGDGRKYLGMMDHLFWEKGLRIISQNIELKRPIKTTDLYTHRFIEKIYFQPTVR